MPRFPKHQVHASVYLARGAVVMGDVSIGADSSVWFNAVLRGDYERVEVGQRTNIQDNAVLHADPGWPCLVGDGVTIGHGAIVHGAVVGPNVVIGMNAVVQNGAHVGENSIIAVGAVVPEGTQIPPGSLVMGVPAKVKRPLTESEIERSRFVAARYVQNAADYAAAERDEVQT